jgi:hypothetical protein
MERRSFPRSLVTHAPQLRSELLLSFDKDDGSAVKRRIAGSIWDVSESGVSFVCASHHDLLELPSGQPIRLVVRYEELMLELDAEVRHVRTGSGTKVVLGMRFRRTEATADSLEQWPGLLWELRCQGGLRDTAASLREAS